MFIEVKWISPLFKSRMHVTVSVSELACMRPLIKMHACYYDRSTAHGAQWQELELMFGQLLQYRNMRERRAESIACDCASLRPAGTFFRACCRPTEAASFREQKCANNRQLIVAGVQRFLRHACAAHFRVIHTRKTPCALCIYTQTLIGVFFIHGKGNMHACLTRG